MMNPNVLSQFCFAAWAVEDFVQAVLNPQFTDSYLQRRVALAKHAIYAAEPWAAVGSIYDDLFVAANLTLYSSADPRRLQTDAPFEHLLDLCAKVLTQVEVERTGLRQQRAEDPGTIDS
jgi:hypothetical protein